MLPPEILSPGPRGSSLKLPGATAAEPDAIEPATVLFSDIVAAEAALPEMPALHRGAAAAARFHPAIAPGSLEDAVSPPDHAVEAPKVLVEPEIAPEAAVLAAPAPAVPAPELEPTPATGPGAPQIGSPVPQPVAVVPERPGKVSFAGSTAPVRVARPAPASAEDIRPAASDGLVPAAASEVEPAATADGRLGAKAPGPTAPPAVPRSEPAEILPAAEAPKPTGDEVLPSDNRKPPGEAPPLPTAAALKVTAPAAAGTEARQEPLRPREVEETAPRPEDRVAPKGNRTGPAVAATLALVEAAARPSAPGVETSPAFGAAPEEWRLAAAEARETVVPRTAPPNVSPAVVAQQLSVAIGRASSDRIEIRLDPPELGRVQIDIRMDEGRLHAAIVVERPEIHDLMRRHADTLMRELEAAGHGRVSLDFSTGTGERSGRDDAPPRYAGAISEPGAAKTASIPEPRRSLAVGLDIRL